MKLFRYLSLSLLALSLTGGTGYCQHAELNVDSLNIKNFKEEIYVQTDRDIYITGEQVWLKIYKLNRLNSAPVNVSKVIYLELLDNSGNIIKQLKTYVEGYSGAASLRLADTLRTGNYLIRAYSNWMENYPEDLFFYKYISVIDPFRNIDRLIKKPISYTSDSVKFSADEGKMISGITLIVDPDINNSAFKIKLLRKGNFTPGGKFCKLAIITSGLITWMKELNIEKDSIIDLPQNSIPSGSSLVILYDDSGNKLADRRIFNRNSRKIDLNISITKQDLTSRQQLTIDIAARDQAGNPVAADLSVSVVKSSLTEKSRINILTKDEYSAVSGEWFSDSLPSHLPELGGQLVNGVLRSKLTHEPLKETDISLAFIGKTSRCQFLKTDANGEFNFVVNKPGLSEIVIQPLKPVQSGYYVEFNQPFCTTFNDHLPPVFSLDSSKTDDINAAVIGMQINKIYEPFREQKKISSSDIDVHDFFGEPDKRINLADYIELTTVREVLKEIVPDVMVNKRNKEYVFKLVNLPLSSSENNPLVLVDGVPFYNLGKLLEVNSKELERIDILNSRYYYTDYIFDGIVSFITKKGNLSSMEYDNSVFRQAFEGCQVQQEFYSPDHGVKNEGTYRIPDFRNTLYWKPDLRSDKDGKTSVTFFTSDEKGDYTIIVEGITPDGKAGISRLPFKVK
jgi:hypothetical protein